MRSGVAALRGAAAPLSRGLDGKLNDAAPQLDPLDRDGRMLDNVARNSFAPGSLPSHHNEKPPPVEKR